MKIKTTEFSEKLKQCREMFPAGTKYISASGRLKTPFRVQGKVRWSKYYNIIISDNAGVLYDAETDQFATILKD